MEREHVASIRNRCNYDQTRRPPRRKDSGGASLGLQSTELQRDGRGQRPTASRRWRLQQSAATARSRRAPIERPPGAAAANGTRIRKICTLSSPMILTRDVRCVQLWQQFVKRRQDLRKRTGRNALVRAHGATARERNLFDGAQAPMNDANRRLSKRGIEFVLKKTTRAHRQ